MSLRINVHRTRRFHMVRFHRAIIGNPDVRYPDPDDRGYIGPEFGPIVGVLAGRTVTVRLKRLSIDRAAPLFVKTSDATAFTVHAPRGGRVPSGDFADIEITGVTGGNPKKAKLEVHYQSLTGPIIHEMSVWVFTPLNVALTPHMVTIGQAGAPAGTAGVPSVANLARIMPLVRAIWGHYGVTFTVNATVNDNLSLATAGSVAWGELPTLLNSNWVPGSINVYLVSQITASSPGFITLGYGFSRTSFAGFGMPNPGIVLADGGGGIVRDTMWWANDMAHEIGHFFTLWHPENLQPPNHREDTWSRRELMHNMNHMNGLGNWKDNVGYGHENRGCFVSMKDLSQLVTDNECTTARGTIGGAAGPY